MLGPVGAVVGEGMGIALKAEEDVKITKTTTAGVVYDEMTQRAKQLPNGDVYAYGERVETGRQVVHHKVVDIQHERVNVRDYTQKEINTGLGAVIVKPRVIN